MVSIALSNRNEFKHTPTLQVHPKISRTAMKREFSLNHTPIAHLGSKVISHNHADGGQSLPLGIIAFTLGQKESTT